MRVRIEEEEVCQRCGGPLAMGLGFQRSGGEVGDVQYRAGIQILNPPPDFFRVGLRSTN